MSLDSRPRLPVQVRPTPTPAEARAIELALERVAGLRVVLVSDER